MNRGTISQAGLQSQVFGQVHIRLELAGAGGGLFAFNIDPLGDIAARRDAGAGVLSGLWVGRPRADAEAVQPQALLDLDQGIETVAAAHSAHRGERGADLRELQRRQRTEF